MKKETGTATIFREIWHFAQPYKRLLGVVVVLSFVYTATDLLYPLVYRQVVNDIAGLFVKQAYDDALEDNSFLNDVIDEIVGMEEPDSTVTEEDTTGLASETEAAPQVLANPDSVARLKHRMDSVARRKRIITKRNSIKQKVARKHPQLLRRNPALASGAPDTTHPATSVNPPPSIDSTLLHPSGAHSSTHVARRTPDQVLQTMIWAVIILFGLGMIGYALWIVAENISERVATNIEQSFLLETFQHVLRLPLGFFRTRSSGVLTKQIDEADHISPIITNLSKHVLPNVVKVVGTFFVMMILNAQLTIIVLVTIPPYIWLVRYSSKRLENGLSTYYELWENISSRLQNAMQAIKTVKLSGAESRELRALQHLSDQAYDEYVYRTKVSNRFVFWDAFISHLGSAVVLIVGGYLALKRQLTPGDVVMFVVYVEELYSPIDELSSVWMELQQNIASFKRTFQLLKSGEEEKSGVALEVSAGVVEFHDVQFSYTSKRKILKGISMQARPGTITAIVGPSGAGKTTSMDLLLKLYDVQSGSIVIDGQDLASLDPASVRAQIGLVAADGVVFKSTVRENVAYCTDGVADSDILEAIEKAGLAPLMERLPEGLDSEIGEGGIGLSVGERQRMQLARIIVAKPPILVLDEATANLDFATEAEIRRTLMDFRKDRTVLIIAHRFSMIRDADYVYVIEDGRISESGTPSTLAQSGGWFSRFASSAQG